MESGSNRSCELNVTSSDISISDDSFLACSSKGLRYFAGAATIIIIVLGVLGNTLTIAALIKCPKIRNLTVAFITSLCVADLSFCLLVMPWSVYRFLDGRNYRYFMEDNILCTLHPLIQYTNVGVSLLSIAMITINRFIMIAWQNMYNRIYTRNTVAAMVVFIWLFSFVILIPTLAGKWGKFGWDRSLGSCSIIDSESAKNTLFQLGFSVPCVSIILCYAGIFWVVYRSRSRVQGHGNNADASNNKGRTGSDWRLTKMILAIFLSFIICYLPATIIKSKDKNVKHPDWHLVGYVLIYLSACINPIIYVTMNRQYRQAYMSVLFSWWSDTHTFVNNSASEKIHHNVNNKTMVSSASVVCGHNVVVSNPNGPKFGIDRSNDIPLTSISK